MRDLVRGLPLKYLCGALCGLFSVSCVGDTGRITAPNSALHDYFCVDYPESDCEYPQYFSKMDMGMSSFTNPFGQIDEDGIVVDCGDLENQYGVNEAADKIGEYVNGDPGWWGYGTIDGDGFIMNRSWLSGADNSEVYWTDLHELRHNLGHYHQGDDDFEEVDSDTAADTCSGLLQLVRNQFRAEQNFVSYLKQFVTEGD